VHDGLPTAARMHQARTCGVCQQQPSPAAAAPPDVARCMSPFAGGAVALHGAAQAEAFCWTTTGSQGTPRDDARALSPLFQRPVVVQQNASACAAHATPQQRQRIGSCNARRRVGAHVWQKDHAHAVARLSTKMGCPPCATCPAHAHAHTTHAARTPTRGRQRAPCPCRAARP
jgi:hypothetical protein